MKNELPHRQLRTLMLALSTFLLFFCNNFTQAQCNPNALYDNMVSGYHGAILKQPDGSFKAWGEYMNNNGTSHVLSPQTIDATNYPVLTGIPLFASLGGNNDHQAILLTTTGLFAWGFEGMVLDGSITSSRNFQKLTINSKTDGLPAGVAPTDVIMMFTSSQLLAILTSNGSVYVISQIQQARGAGSGASSSTQWYQVTTNATGNPALTNVTAIRGNGRGGMMALTSTAPDGLVYTWGASTFLGDNTGEAALTRARTMTLPTGVIANNIKMIGMTANTTTRPSSYYILTKSGSLYGLGENSNRQLGDFTTTDRTGWVNVQKTSGNNFTDCIFFSPNEHDVTNAAVAAIDANYDLYTWGINSQNMLGQSGSPVDPGIPAGFTPGTENVFNVEVGGHISLCIKEGSNKYCYLGHRINGSMGDGLNTSSTITSWDCTNTGNAQACGSTGFDAGDAPFSYEGNAGTDYCTHNISVPNSTSLYLGTSMPTANNLNPKNVAPYADNTGTNGDGTEDDGLPGSINGAFIGNGSYSLNVNVTNTTGANANLYGWIDWNLDGDFLDAGEMVSVVVPNGATTAILNYPTVPSNIIPGVKYYMRLRFTSATLTSPLGYAPDGEVEDYFMSAVQPAPDVNATWVNAPVTGNVSTNDGAPTGSQYGLPVAVPGNPNATLPSLNPDGTYSFTTTLQGIYYFNVPVCPPGQASGCPLVELKITVLDSTNTNNLPVANTDIATTPINTAVTLQTLINDNVGNIGATLNPASVTVTNPPTNGTTTVNPATGEITYTPNTNFVGIDTLTYQVCDNTSPTALCASAQQIITVLPVSGTANITEAADDYNTTYLNTPVSGNVLPNDSDPNGNTQLVTPQNTTLPGIGNLVLNSVGTYTFTPDPTYVGPASFPYEVCDNGSPIACTKATLYILVRATSTVPVTLLSFSAERNNKDIVVKWKTGNESSIGNYEVEFSTNGNIFTSARTVAPLGATSENNYQITLINFTEPVYYIRLKSVDIDGSSKYSAIIKITRGTKPANAVTVLQNPAIEVINLQILSAVAAKSEIKLVNNLGQVVYRMKTNILKGTNLVSLNNINQLAPGVYTVQLIINNERLITKAFIK